MSLTFAENALITRAVPDLSTWHQHLGHVNYSSIIDMARKSLMTGMPIDLSALPPICKHCIAAKQMKTPVPRIRGERAQRKFEKVHSEITGPQDVNMLYGDRYMLNFIDDFSHMGGFFPLNGNLMP